MKFYSHYNVPPKVVTEIGDGSMTCQEFKDECDINKIVKKPNYGINPLNPPTVKPQYDDFTNIQYTDFYAAQNLICEAVQQFENLDSSVRKYFDNDPGKLLEFINDEKNYDKAVEIGLCEKRVSKSDTPSQSASYETISAVSDNRSAQNILDVNERTDTIPS